MKKEKKSKLWFGKKQLKNTKCMTYYHLKGKYLRKMILIMAFISPLRHFANFLHIFQ